VSAIVVVTTVGTEEQANQMAENLVARRHACCVNILPVHRSVYRWQGRICSDSEFLLVIKTLDSEYEQIERAIKELHSYELPEILAFGVQRGEEGFLQWLTGCVGGQEGESPEAEADADSAED
jgi:periplasmic divalent cation tolerance protein